MGRDQGPERAARPAPRQTPVGHRPASLPKQMHSGWTEGQNPPSDSPPPTPALEGP